MSQPSSKTTKTNQRSNKTTKTKTAKTPPTQTTDLRERILADFATLQLPLGSDALDAALAQAEREKLSHLQFLQRLLAEPANGRRERSIARRIREARFREHKTLADFDWQFNAKTIDRAQMEELATGDFIRRRDNLVFVGQSGVGKSFLIQAIGMAACVVGYRVRYFASADLLQELTASLADHSLPKLLRSLAKHDLLIIDEFGFDHIERNESPQASNLLYKVIDSRNPNKSTALVTNIEFEVWAEYLGDRHLAMGFLDRVVDGAIIHKLKGKSYRAHRARQPKMGNQAN